MQLKYLQGEKQGFTMVELSLSITFIAILSIIVVVMISNAVSSYHRGLTLNQINTVGMELVDNMRTTIQSSPAYSVMNECTGLFTEASHTSNCEADKAMKFVVIERKAQVRVSNKDTIPNTPVSGVFCTGKYSYIWNSGYWFGDEYSVEGVNISAVNVEYQMAGGGIKTWSQPRLLRIQDNRRMACKNIAGVINGDPGNSNYNTNPTMGNKIDVTGVIVDEEPVDLLATNNSLAVYDLTTAPPAENGVSNNMFYSVSFVLGTMQGGVNVQAAGNYCAAPEDYTNESAENFDYCAINKFNFAATATGG